MYLPQYHPIPENDKAWGNGFTEWTNVAKATKLFRGHYQPRIPKDLGFYDLRLEETREAQAEMARQAGIDGFMYWHYWFGGGRVVLERPIREIIASGKPDYPICLGWGNHSWTTRSWNGQNQLQRDTVIVEQTYPGEQDWINHFKYLEDIFRDNRYIKVKGNLLFVIYDPLGLPNVEDYMQCWRELAHRNGLGGFHFVALVSGGQDKCKQIYGLKFDAFINSNMWKAEMRLKGKVRKLVENKLRNIFPYFALDIYNYEDITRNFWDEDDLRENVYLSVIPQWDRSPRSGRRAVIYKNSSPDKFYKHLKEAVVIQKQKKCTEKIIFLRSWNEWGEGNYVEPDLKYGSQYLEVIRKCLREIH